MEQLRSLVDSAKQGRGGLVMIGGEPGVGKTRLVQELIHEARASGFLSLAGHCSELEGAPAFAPWIEILETVVAIAPRDTVRTLLGDAAPEIAKLLPELRRECSPICRSLSSFRRPKGGDFSSALSEAFVERSSHLQPLLLILEDLHWSDQASLLLLQNLAPAARPAAASDRGDLS